MKQILDSGNRRLFETGANRDVAEGKGRCDLMPLDIVAGFYKHWDINGDYISELINAVNVFLETGKTKQIYVPLGKFMVEVMKVDPDEFMLEIAKHYENGCLKYGDRNWQKGIPCHCYVDSGMRHLFKYLAGQEDEPHDRAFIWNFLCLIWTKKHHPQLDDIDHKLIKGGK